jgi:phage tail-like protein
MASLIKKYKIGAHKIERACMHGFELLSDGTLYADGSVEFARIFLGCLDGVMEGCPWGRFVFDAKISEDTVFTVRTCASDNANLFFDGAYVPFDDILLDPNVPDSDKLAIFDRFDAAGASDRNDTFLNGHEGRYLWVCLTVRGGASRFSEFRAYAPGDNFFQSFPEVYRADGEFFHRYMSVFSSIYNDFQEKIDAIDMLLDPDQAPVELLPVYASWFGISIDGDFIDETKLRTLIKKAFSLIRKKGNRSAIKELVEIFVDEPFFIVEQHDAVSRSDAGSRFAMERIYEEDPFVFTLLLCCPPDEKLHMRLAKLIEQFKPLRMRAHILFLEGNATLDGGANLDINAALAYMRKGSLDDSGKLDGTEYII